MIQTIIISDNIGRNWLTANCVHHSLISASAHHLLCSHSSGCNMIEWILIIMIFAELYVAYRIFLEVISWSGQPGPLPRTTRVPVTMKGHKIRPRVSRSDCPLWNTLFPEYNNYLYEERKRLGLHITLDDLYEAQRRHCNHVHDERCLAHGCDRDKDLPHLYRGLYSFPTPGGLPQLYYFESAQWSSVNENLFYYFFFFI